MADEESGAEAEDERPGKGGNEETDSLDGASDADEADLLNLLTRGPPSPAGLAGSFPAGAAGRASSGPSGARQPSTPLGADAAPAAAAALVAGLTPPAPDAAAAKGTAAVGEASGVVGSGDVGAAAGSVAGREEPSDEEFYEDLFDMMMNEWPGDKKRPEKQEAPRPDDAAQKRDNPEGLDADGRGQEGQGSQPVFLNPKRARVQPLEQPAGQDPLVGSHALASIAGREEYVEPPPLKIMAAYARLELPITATTRDVERRTRRLSRHAHPDKVPAWMRPQAAQDFREVQEAKVTVLTWIRERRVEESDSPVYDATSDEEGGLMDPNTECIFGEEKVEEGYESPGSERGDEMKVCGACDPDGAAIDPGELHSDASAEEESVGAGSGGEGGPAFGLALAGGAHIRSEENPLQQAMALSKYEAGGRPRKRACSECLEREVKKGMDVCSQCQAEMRRLWRRLGRGADGEQEA